MSCQNILLASAMAQHPGMVFTSRQMPHAEQPNCCTCSLGVLLNFPQRKTDLLHRADSSILAVIFSGLDTTCKQSHLLAAHIDLGMPFAGLLEQGYPAEMAGLSAAFAGTAAEHCHQCSLRHACRHCQAITSSPSPFRFWQSIATNAAWDMHAGIAMILDL